MAKLQSARTKDWAPVMLMGSNIFNLAFFHWSLCFCGFFLTLLLQTMLKADLYLRGQRCRFSTKIKYWGETVSRQLFNVKMFTGKVYTSEMKTQTRKNS